MTFFLILIGFIGVILPPLMFVEHDVTINLNAPIYYGSFRNPKSARNYTIRFGIHSLFVLALLSWANAQSYPGTGTVDIFIAIAYVSAVCLHHPYVKSYISKYVWNIYAPVMWCMAIVYYCTNLYLMYLTYLIYFG